MSDNDRDDDDEIGGPVAKLSPNDPLNRALGAFQLLFMNVHETVLDFIAAKVDLARVRRLRGWLDVKLTVDGDRLIVRRVYRADDKPPRGNWWNVPLVPAVLDELYERLKPAPPEEPKKDFDVDASVAPSEPVKSRLPDLLRQRAREAATLAGNIKRTLAEIKLAGHEVHLDRLGGPEAMEAAREALEDAANRLEPQ